MKRCVEIRLPAQDATSTIKLDSLKSNYPQMENTYEVKESMYYKRCDHSFCYLDNNYLFVTGSYISDSETNTSCERYDVQNDRFIRYPPLNVGRCHHSSCSFDGRFVFVLCGLVIVKS